MESWLREHYATWGPHDHDHVHPEGVPPLLNLYSSQDNDELPSCDVGPAVGPGGPTQGLFFLLRADRYFGVPGNLVINVFVFAGGVILFSLLRRKAWNYGRLALLDRVQRAPYHFIRNDDGGDSGRSTMQSTTPILSRTKWFKTKMFARHEAFATTESMDTGGYFTWIKWVFMLSLTRIGERCGEDAVQYLLFQQYIMLFLFVLTILCMGVIMPINIFASPVSNSTRVFTGLNMTVIANLHPRTNFLWVHVSLGMALFPFGVWVMTQYRRKLVSIFGKMRQLKSRTVMVEMVPREKCTQGILQEYFRETYPTLHVSEIRFAYNVRDLEESAYRREMTKRARMKAEDYNRMKGTRLTLLPFPFGNAVGKLCFWMPCVWKSHLCNYLRIDAVEYYTKLEMEMSAMVKQAIVRSIEEPVGIVFVTFKSIREAFIFYSAVGGESAFGANAVPKSRLSRELRTNRWVASLAPDPTDIKWKNLHLSGETFALRSWCVNSILFIFLFLLATGQYIWYFARVFTEILFSHPVIGPIDRQSSFFLQFLEMIREGLQKFFPSILLLLMRFLLPRIIYETDRALPYRTYSSQQNAQMAKVFAYLFIAVVFLQAFGFGALWNWFLYVRQAEGRDLIKWHCMFLPNKGFTFFNYLITAAFTANAIELLRVADLICYVFRMAKAKSCVEDAHAKSHLTMEFKYGVQYAWVMLMVTTSIMFSIACPLISLAGLLQISVKHFTDRYNIYFAYRAVRVQGRTHEGAVSIFYFSIFMQQLSLTFFNFLRQQRDVENPMYVVSSIGVAIMGSHLAVRVFKNMVKHRTPLFYASLKSDDPRAHLEEKLLRSKTDLHRSPESDHDMVLSHDSIDAEGLQEALDSYERWVPSDSERRPYVSPVFAALEKKARREAASGVLSREGENASGAESGDEHGDTSSERLKQGPHREELS